MAMRAVPTPTDRLFAVSRLAALAVVAVAAGATALGAPQEPAMGRPAPDRIVHEGIAIDFSMHPAEGDGWKRPPRPGDDVIFRFAIADTVSGTPLPGANPAAWLGLRTPGEPLGPDRCTAKISTFLGGSILSAAELDLNVYYVLALNDDASITVVDPLFGFGDTKLLAMVELPGPGEDWVLTGDEDTLFVSIPAAGKVAVVDTTTWKVAGEIDIDGAPQRLGIQPDGAYLWVTHAATAEGGADGTRTTTRGAIPDRASRRSRRGADGARTTTRDGRVDGVSVIDVETLAVEATIATGAGPHDIAFSDDSRFVFVTSAGGASGSAHPGGGAVSIIGVRELRKLADLATGGRPVSVDFASISQMAYVADEATGTIAVVDADRLAVVARIQSEPGIGQIRFVPGRRIGLVVNPLANTVDVIDAVSSRVVQTGYLLSGPDQIVFSDELAYIRHRGDETVLMIPLGEIGTPGEPVGTVDFPGGQSPFGAGAGPGLADTIVQAPGANAVLIANPADRAIYFYMEGMAAPMGSFSNYSRQPRAVLVVDRSLRERRPGVYETVATLREPGTYDVAFFLDAPRILHCFEIEVEADPAAPPPASEVRVVSLNGGAAVRAGEETTLRFRLLHGETGEPLSGLADVRVLALLAPGTWQERQWAREVEPAVYAVELTPPRPGVYYVYLEVASLGLELNNPQYSIIRVFENNASAAAAREAAAGPGEEEMNR
jgi:YVTN family beta-propeller protein